MKEPFAQVIKFDLGSISGDKLSVSGDSYTIYVNGDYKDVDYMIQVKNTIGYWGNRDNPYCKAASDTLASGQTWKTLEQYNANNGTSYTWG